MTHKLEKIVFRLENGSTWGVEEKNIGDMWVKRVARSIGRIHGGEIVELYPSQAFKIEIAEEANVIADTDINFGAVEAGVFEAVIKLQNIEFMEMHWEGGADTQIISFPFDDNGDQYNDFMSAKVGENGKLYIVISETQTVNDVYPNV